MKRRLVTPRPLRALLAAVAGFSLLAALPAAAAPVSPTVAAGARSASAPLNPALTPYGGGGSAEQANVAALNVGGSALADVGLAHSSAQVDSTGINDGAERSTAAGLQANPLEALGLDLDVLADAVQVAPPDAGAPATDISVDLDGGPVFDLGVAEALARARWASDTECVTPGEPISLGRLQTAGTSVLSENGLVGLLDLNALLDMLDSLELVDTLGTFFSEASLIGLLDDAGAGVLADLLETLGLAPFLEQLVGGFGPILEQIEPVIGGVEGLLDALELPDLSGLIEELGLQDILDGLGLGGLTNGAVLDLGAATTEVTVTLVEAPGLADGHYALETQSTTTLAGVSLFGGLLEIGVADGIQATATATGNDSASATTSIPLLSVSIAGAPPIEVPADNLGALEDLINGVSDVLGTVGLDAVLDLGLRVAGSATETAADGTTASASAVLLGLDVEVLGTSLVDLDVAPVLADAAVPVGGVDCGLPDDDNPLRELNKHASATEVAVGGTFEYNIAVPNRGPCALTDVVVTDTMTGPGTIASTEPPADEVSADGKMATWNIGDLAVNETVNLTITVQVDADAPVGETFDDHVLASGNCDGREVEQPDEVLDIPKVVDDFEGPCNVQFSNKDASHITVMNGQTFSYYVHAYNTGADPCTDVVITDTLDDRVSFVDCNKGCTNEGQTVTWNVDQIAGGSSVILSVVVQVNDDATGTLGNIAVIDPGNGDPKTVTSTGPEIGLESLPKDPAPASRGPSGPLPSTGATMPIALATLLAAAAAALFGLRRRATTA